LFVGNLKKKEEIVQLFMISRGNTIGEEDIVPLPTWNKGI
jgi:hypothetical protein